MKYDTSDVSFSSTNRRWRLRRPQYRQKTTPLSHQAARWSSVSAGWFPLDTTIRRLDGFQISTSMQWQPVDPWECPSQEDQRTHIPTKWTLSCRSQLLTKRILYHGAVQSVSWQETTDFTDNERHSPNYPVLLPALFFWMSSFNYDPPRQLIHVHLLMIIIIPCHWSILLLKCSVICHVNFIYISTPTLDDQKSLEALMYTKYDRSLQTPWIK